MKNVKKVLCLVLTLVMVFSITCTTAFADDSGDNHEMPEGLIGTTIEVSVAPGDDAGIMPLIWDQKDVAVGNVVTNTYSFVVPERYFAYECVARDRETGEAVNGSCKVELKEGSLIHATLDIDINGKTHKEDWIDLQGSDSTCYFRITNYSDAIINVLITYYSWT